MHFTTKKAIRQHYRQVRKSQNPSGLSQASLAEIANAKVFINAKHIAFYLAIDGEFNLQPLIAYAFSQHKKCYLPRVNFAENAIEFYAYEENTVLVVNRYGIPEPAPDPVKLISPNQIDCAFLPLVAIDDLGYRLGMGGGYYDRAFHFTLTRAHEKPILIGAGFECQWCESLPRDPWDLKLDGYLTEQQLYLFRNI